MNKKVYEVMLFLCILFLFICYAIKIFIPDYFIMTIENEKLVMIGKFIDNNYLIYCICAMFFGFLTFYIYTCACCRTKKLSLKQTLIIFLLNIISILAYKHTNMGIHFSTCLMLFIPTLLKADLKDTILIFAIHGFSQIFSLNIRNLPILIDQFNYMQFLMLNIDQYIWLFILLLVQLSNKEVGIWELVHHRITEQKNNFLKKRLKKQE